MVVGRVYNIHQGPGGQGLRLQCVQVLRAKRVMAEVSGSRRAMDAVSMGWESRDRGRGSLLRRALRCCSIAVFWVVNWPVPVPGSRRLVST